MLMASSEARTSCAALSCAGAIAARVVARVDGFAQHGHRQELLGDSYRTSTDSTQTGPKSLGSKAFVIAVTVRRQGQILEAPSS